MEHAASERLVDRIDHYLGYPSVDPHGDPIPGPDLDVADDRTTVLAALEPGRTATFARVSDSDPEMLRYLAERGIRPGARVRVRELEPFGGPLLVDVGGREHALGRELADRVRVEVEEGRR
jgi:DtxR family Mn-dependent transcriptional regulator